MKREKKYFFKNIKNFKKFTKCYWKAQVKAQPRGTMQKSVISGLDKLPSQRKTLSKVIDFSKRTSSMSHKQETKRGDKQSYDS